MRLALSFILTLSILKIAFAQPQVGIKAGINVNSLHASEMTFLDEPSENIGWHLGGYVSVAVSKKLIFNPELQFSRRGASFGSYSHILSCVELPLLISYAVKKVSFDVGPTLAYRFSAAAHSDGNSVNIDEAYDAKFDFGPAAGIQFQFTEKISVVARYYFGLTSILDVQLRDEQNMPLGEIHLYNRTGQVGLKYKLKT
jgi:hypothetical protein